MRYPEERLGCCCGSGGEPDHYQTPQRDVYEYTHVQSGGMSAHDRLQMLNGMGINGWQLVELNRSNWSVFFMRKVV